MQVKLKNIPKLMLSDLLRRRKMTLKQFLDESGIYAYAALINKCNEIGVQPPLEKDYLSAVPTTVSSPQDGIIVLDPIVDPVIDPILSDHVQRSFDESLTVEDESQKKRKKKKEVQSPENDSK